MKAGKRRQPRPKKVPDGAAGKAAAILGNGEGMRKLCYVLGLSDYDDGRALLLADVGAILGGADALAEKPGAELTEDDRVILSRAIRLRAVLEDEGVDRFIARAVAEREAVPVTPEDLREGFLDGLVALSRWAQSVSGLLTEAATHGVDLGFSGESMKPLRDAIDELAQRVAALRPEVDA